LGDHHAGSFLIIVALGWRKQGRMGQPWLDPTVWYRRKMLCLIEMGDVGRHPIDVLSYLTGGYRKAYQILNSYVAKGSEERIPIQIFSAFRHD
jgi:predicted dehydrogenase